MSAGTIAKGKVVNIDKVKFASRARGSKYDDVLTQIEGLDAGQVLVLNCPADIEGDEPLDKFAQSLRSAVKGRFGEEGGLLDQYKFRTRKTEDETLAVFWQEIEG